MFNFVLTQFELHSPELRKLILFIVSNYLIHIINTNVFFFSQIRNPMLDFLLWEPWVYH